jgi:hypothetical protein
VLQSSSLCQSLFPSAFWILNYLPWFTCARTPEARLSDLEK